MIKKLAIAVVGGTGTLIVSDVIGGYIAGLTEKPEAPYAPAERALFTGGLKGIFGIAGAAGHFLSKVEDIKSLGLGMAVGGIGGAILDVVAAAFAKPGTIPAGISLADVVYAKVKKPPIIYRPPMPPVAPPVAPPVVPQRIVPFVLRR